MAHAKGHKRGAVKPKNVKLRPAPGIEGKGKERGNPFSESDDNDERSNTNEEGDLTYESSLIPQKKPLEGCLISFSGLKVNGRQNVLADKVKQLGGRVEGGLYPEITHLVCEVTGSEKYKTALDYRITTVMPGWITDVYDRWIGGDTISESQVARLAFKYRIPFFRGLILCTTGFSDSELSDITSEIQEQEGYHRASFDSGITHLVIKDLPVDADGQVHYSESTRLKIERAIKINVRAEAAERRRIREKQEPTGETLERPFVGGVWVVNEKWLRTCLAVKGRVGEGKYVAIEWKKELEELEKEMKRVQKEKLRKRKREESSELAAPPSPPSFNDNSQSTFIPHFQHQSTTVDATTFGDADVSFPAPPKKARKDILKGMRIAHASTSTAHLTTASQNPNQGVNHLQEPNKTNSNPTRRSMISALSRSRSEKTIFPITSTAVLTADRLQGPPPLPTQEFPLIPKVIQEESEKEDSRIEETKLIDPLFYGLKISHTGLTKGHQAIVLRATKKLGAEYVENVEEADYVVAPSWVSPPYPDWADQDNPKIVSTFWVESSFDNGRLRSRDEDGLLRPIKVGFPEEAFKDRGLGVSAAGYDEAKVTYISRFCTYCGIDFLEIPTRTKFTHLIAPEGIPSSRIEKAKEWGKVVITLENFIQWLEEEWNVIRTLDFQRIKQIDEQMTESKLKNAENPLVGCVILVSKKNIAQLPNIRDTVQSLGGTLQVNFSPEVTHFIHSSQKVNESFGDFKSARSGGKFIVHPKWVEECGERKERVDEKLFPHTWQTNRSLSFTTQGSVIGNHDRSRRNTMERSTPISVTHGSTSASAEVMSHPMIKENTERAMDLELDPEFTDIKSPIRFSKIAAKESLHVESEEQFGSSPTPSMHMGKEFPVTGNVVTSSPSVENATFDVVQTRDKIASPSDILAGKLVNLLKNSLDQGEEEHSLLPFRPIKPRARSKRQASSTAGSTSSARDSSFQPPEQYYDTQNFAETQDTRVKMIFEDKIGQAEKLRILKSVMGKKRTKDVVDLDGDENQIDQTRIDFADAPAKKKSRGLPL